MCSVSFCKVHVNPSLCHSWKSLSVCWHLPVNNLEVSLSEWLTKPKASGLWKAKEDGIVWDSVESRDTAKITSYSCFLSYAEMSFLYYHCICETTSVCESTLEPLMTTIWKSLYLSQVAI